MVLNSKNNQFILLFPKDFFDKETVDLYKTHYDNMMLPYKSVEDFICSTVKKFEFPGLSVETRKQILMYSKEREHKGAMPIDNLLDKNLRITFKMTEGFFNYMLLHRNFIRYMNRDAAPYKETFWLGGVTNEGYLLWYFEFTECIITGMDGFTFDYTKTSNEQETFTMDLKYNLWNANYVVGEPVNLIRNVK